MSFCIEGMRRRFYPFEKKPFHFSHRTIYLQSGEQKKIWDRTTELLRDLGTRRIVTTHAFVLMSNHFHALWAPNEAEQNDAFDQLTKGFGKIFECKTPKWEDSVFEIDSFYRFHEVYKYIYRNPVEAGLVRNVEDYPFSTIQNVLGVQRNIAGLM